ncbi:MAG: IS66 family transposase [Chlamydiia bacterium]|nr:IS66 family transposase [Simkania sp.]MCB1115884.1 IS66 family transposase [Chlamydiia bacterium]MCB9092652.1 IS66 family transposase [Halobacteriovoraceae bacterium]
MKPTYDELLKIIEEQRKTIERLEKRVQELEEQLKQNSGNSSKPPSTDKKKNKQSPKGGAKKGHAGHYRKLLPQEKVTNRVIAALETCPHCGSKDLKKKPSQILQQVELPDIDPIVTQIECERAKCRCCQKSLKAPFPEKYQYSHFGPRLITFIGMCSSVYRLSKRSIKELLEMIFKIKISLGSVPAQKRKLSKGLKPLHEKLKEQIDKAPVAYVDETSFREEAQTRYIWTASNKSITWLKVLPGRSIASLNQIRPRGDPGITVTDRYQVYAYKKHQYCLAHIKRDLKKFAERKSEDQNLAENALFELQEIFSATHLPCKETMRQRVYYRKKRLENTLLDILANGSDTFARFAERLLNQFQKLFFFTKNTEVECTNNTGKLHEEIS